MATPPDLNESISASTSAVVATPSAAIMRVFLIGFSDLELQCWQVGV